MNFDHLQHSKTTKGRKFHIETYTRDEVMGGAIFIL